ncbi:MAG: hypothetical protein NVSMB21_15930 [Vulcanimicrobiaceae bacterium]
MTELRSYARERDGRIEVHELERIDQRVPEIERGAPPIDERGGDLLDVVVGETVGQADERVKGTRTDAVPEYR